MSTHVTRCEDLSGQKTRVPFGWGAKITPARIAADNGVGGELGPHASVVHSITLPKGKWSISLGLTLPDNQSSNLIGKVDLLDEPGFSREARFVFVNETGNQARKEGVITVTKPTPFLLRVVNDRDVTYTYDVTIDKAE